MSDGGNIQVEITHIQEFHCFRLVLNPRSAGCVEILLHATQLVDLLHKGNLALSDWQHQTTAYLLERLGA